jgi:hypothetical protein
MDVLANYVLLIPAILISAALAYFRGSKWASQNENKKPYAWGIYNGIFAIIMVPTVAIIFLISRMLGEMSSRELEEALVISLMVGLPYAVIGYFVLKRKRWAWILLILADIKAPVMMVINIIYLKNRWKEFKEEAQHNDLTQTRVTATLQNKKMRFGIFVSVVWAVGAALVIVLFEFYGGRIRGDEWIHFWMVLILPPLFLNTSWFVYEKYVK